MSSRRIFSIHAALLVVALLAFSAASSSSLKKALDDEVVDKNRLRWQDKCVYTLYIETGSVIKAGTDSRISITLSDSKKNSVWIPNVKKWGLMGPKHDYFERGSLDVFTGLGPCIGAPICRLNVTSDGSGAHHGWLCDSVEVTSTGHSKGCSQSIFYVNQWLATDAPPYQLSAVFDGCGDFVSRKNGRPFYVGKPVGSISASASASK